MVQIFLSGLGPTNCICVKDNLTVDEFQNEVSAKFGGIPSEKFYLSTGKKVIVAGLLSDYVNQDGCNVKINMRLLGGIDFQVLLILFK